MEYGYEINIFVLNMVMISGIEKLFFWNAQACVLKKDCQLSIEQGSEQFKFPFLPNGHMRGAQLWIVTDCLFLFLQELISLQLQ